MKPVLVRKKEIQETLSATSSDGKRLLQPLRAISLGTGMPVNILEDQNVWNDAEVHLYEDDLWYCLEGEVTFVYGGEMINPWYKQNPDGTKDTREMKAKEIQGGMVITLRPGDWFWIPAGEPHQHGVRTGTARLVIIKIPHKTV